MQKGEMCPNPLSGYCNQRSQLYGSLLHPNEKLQKALLALPAFYWNPRMKNHQTIDVVGEPKICMF